MGSEACALKGCPSSYAIELRLFYLSLGDVLLCVYFVRLFFFYQMVMRLKNERVNFLYFHPFISFFFLLFYLLPFILLFFLPMYYPFHLSAFGNSFLLVAEY